MKWPFWILLQCSTFPHVKQVQLPFSSACVSRMYQLNARSSLARSPRFVGFGPRFLLGLLRSLLRARDVLFVIRVWNVFTV